MVLFGALSNSFEDFLFCKYYYIFFHAHYFLLLVTWEHSFVAYLVVSRLVLLAPVDTENKRYSPHLTNTSVF